MTERLSHQQADALAAVENAGGSILLAREVGGQIGPICPHHLLPGQGVWETGEKSPVAIKSLIPRDYSGPMLHVLNDGSSTGGIPVAKIYDPETREWKPFQIMLDYSVHEKAPPRSRPELEPTPAKPSSHEARRRYRDETTRLAACHKEEEEAKRRVEEAEAKIGNYQNRQDRIGELQDERKRRKAEAYARDGSECDTSALDREIENAARSQKTDREDASVVAAALPELRESYERLVKRRTDQEAACAEARAAWARERSAGSLASLAKALERLSEPLTELAALDSMLNGTSFGHLTEADRYRRELAKPFHGFYPITPKPTWANSSKQLPGMAAAVDRLNAELNGSAT